jgi:predicted DNA-binding protein (MmcQ/YjbR family)
LAKFLKADADQQATWKSQNKNASAPVSAKAYAFVDQLRNMTITAFKTNEYIAENVLAYAPIPGEQKGCVDLMEATGGKAWSL